MKSQERARRIAAAQRRIDTLTDRAAKAQAVVDETKAALAYERTAALAWGSMPVEDEPSQADEDDES